VTETQGLSINSTYSRIGWLRTIRDKIKYKSMKNVMVTIRF
jgi:hypothetical protein